MNNEPISDEEMMHFIASCFAMNGILANAGYTQVPSAATLAEASKEYADAMMQRIKNAKKKHKDRAMH